jgi:acetoacetate decarboxylase
MSSSGKLTKERFGYDGPVNAPLFQKPPLYFRGVEAMSVLYETEEKAAQALVPDGLEIPLPPTVNFTVFSAPSTSVGPYNSAIVRVNCLWQGQPKGYVCYQIVTGDAAMAAGREIWGYPKKMGTVDINKNNQMFTATVARPSDHRLCTVTVRREEPLDEEAIASLAPTLRSPIVCLKVIPSPIEGEGPSIAQLVEPGSSSSLTELWQGIGSIDFDKPSPTDPWHELVVKRVIGSYYSKYDQVLTYGSVLKIY